MSKELSRQIMLLCQYANILLLILSIALLVACLPSVMSDETTQIEVTNPATIALEDEGKIASETREPSIEINLDSATVTPHITATLPPEVARSFDREQCPDYCWHNIMLGQNESEVLDAIRNDPATDTTFDFQDGDFVQIEQFENARVGIDWEILSIPYHRMRTHGSLFLDNNVVTFLVVPIEPPFPFQVVLDKLGNPELLDFIDGSDGFALLSLMYPKERVWFNVRVTGNPLTLTGESMVESVAYSSMELAQEDYCIAGYFHWGGLGDLSTYFTPNGLPNDELYIDSLPEGCPSN